MVNRYAFMLVFVIDVAVGATINVTTSSQVVADDGACSLPEAIENANQDTRLHVDCDPGSGADVISLRATGPYNLSAAHHSTSRGQTGLPTIAAGVPGSPGIITIVGNGATIQRSSTLFDTPCEPCGGNGAKFRIFEVDTTGRLTLENLAVRNGCAAGGGLGSEGGAILTHGVLTLRKVTISNNAAVSGGAISIQTALAFVENSTLVNNQAAENGGAIYGLGGTAVITNSTLGLNRAGNEGGALYVRLGDEPSNRLVAVTLAENKAPLGSDVAGRITLASSIVASPGSCKGPVVSGGSNLSVDSTCASAGPGDRQNTPTGLASYTSAVEPGSGVFPLLATSPAIDAGGIAVCPATDQLGRTRSQGCDSGAFEFRAGETLSSQCVLNDLCTGRCDVVADATPPVITPIVSPTANGAGWHNSPVTVGFAVYDPESPVIAQFGCSTVTLSAETSASGFILTCSATSAGGTGSLNVTVRIDLTAPQLTAPAPVLVNATSQLGAVIPTLALGTATASDALSGSPHLVRTGVPAGNQFPIGNTTLTYTATDLAGNAISQTQRVTVRSGAIRSGSLIRAAKVPAGVNPQACAIADVNGDGRADLLVADWSGRALVLLQQPNGTFAHATGSPFLAGINPDSIIPADFNKDGFVDFAVANYSSASLHIYLGAPGGSFLQAPGSPIAVGQQPMLRSAPDLNADKMADLVVANYGSNSVSVLLGTGDGRFRPAVGSPYAVGSGPLGIGTADFNRDGRIDILVANRNSNTLTLLLGTSGGSFSPGVMIPAGNGPVSITIGDHNRDSHADAVVANTFDGTLSLFIGTGSGTFYNVQQLQSGSGVNGVAQADLNGDDMPDLISPNMNSGSISIFMGSFGRFVPAPGSPFSTGGSLPVFVSTGDLDSDGRVDIAVANFLSGDITLFYGAVTPTTVSLVAPTDGAVLSASQSVTLRAQVLPSGVAALFWRPSGTVRFFDGGVALGSSTLAVAGSASIVLPGLSLGTHRLSVSYLGDVMTSPSASAVTSVIVQ